MFNIGTGEETAVSSVLHKIVSLMKVSTIPKFESARQGEQKRSVLSYAKAKVELGWSPKTTLDQGLAQTIEYFRREQR
jgi:nucleoside-diphosphate-sugar epimerase